MAERASPDALQAADPRSAQIAAYGPDSLVDDPALSRITEFASRLCDCPIALVSLVESQRQRFLARTGLGASETPRSQSFCAHAMLDDAVMVVPDATADRRFADNELVTGEPQIRFYAGAPLVTPDGTPLGALCVIDRKPREGLSEFQREGLEVLAEAVMARLEARRHEIATSWGESQELFRMLADSMPQMVWSTLPDGFHDYYNARWYEFTGVPAGSTDGEGWNDMFHPDDQKRAFARWTQSLETGDPYEIEYRLRRADGEYRWTIGRALPIRNAQGDIIRWFGTCTEIHEQKTLLEARDLLSRELGHRIKNIFSLVSGVLNLTVRSRPELREAASVFQERLFALARTHDLVDPQSGRSHVRVRDLIADLVQPWVGEDRDRIRYAGPDVPVSERSATPLALLFHELVTNSAKYGALSVSDGTIAVTVDGDDDVRIIWSETGARALEPTRAGFGTELVQASVERQLRGTIAREWGEDGLTVTITVPRNRL